MSNEKLPWHFTLIAMLVMVWGLAFFGWLCITVLTAPHHFYYAATVSMVAIVGAYFDWWPKFLNYAIFLSSVVVYRCALWLYSSVFALWCLALLELQGKHALLIAAVAGLFISYIGAWVGIIIPRFVMKAWWVTAIALWGLNAWMLTKII